MQQIHTIKTSVKDQDVNSICSVEMEKLNEGCSLLTQTCDTFIHTLDETMRIANPLLNQAAIHYGEANGVGINNTRPATANGSFSTHSNVRVLKNP